MLIFFPSNYAPPRSGYVFHNLPSCDEVAMAPYLEACGLKENRPQWIIDLMPVSEDEWNVMRDAEVFAASIARDKKFFVCVPFCFV